MPFTPYAQSPGRRAAQVTGDVLLVVWVALCVRAGLAVHAATTALAEPGRRLEAGADDVAASLRQAGERAADLPLVGRQLAGPFDSAADAAGAIAGAGREQVEVVGHLALLLGLAVAAVPVLVALALWVPPRVRFARRAGAARRLVDSAGDLRLFALRAMANQPVHRLARVSPDPVAAWRSGDEAVIAALAGLELADAGLRPPAARPGNRVARVTAWQDVTGAREDPDVDTVGGRRGLRVGAFLTIPDAELSWRFSRSSGPGGQGVNTADSRVELSWDVAASTALTEHQRDRLLARLAARLVGTVLTVTASEHRAQLRNRDAARARLGALVAEALRPPARTRRPTRPTRGSQQRRIEAKKQRGATKRLRRPPTD